MLNLCLSLNKKNHVQLVSVKSNKEYYRAKPFKHQHHMPVLMPTSSNATGPSPLKTWNNKAEGHTRTPTTQTQTSNDPLHRTRRPPMIVGRKQTQEALAEVKMLQFVIPYTECDTRSASDQHWEQPHGPYNTRLGAWTLGVAISSSLDSITPCEVHKIISSRVGTLTPATQAPHDSHPL